MDHDEDVNGDTAEEVQNELREIFHGAEEDEEIAAATTAACAGAAHSHHVFVESTVCEGGRRKGAKSISRGRCTWYDDYLAENPSYPPRMFREVFRIPVKLYTISHCELIAHEPQLDQEIDCCGKTGHSSHQKILCADRRPGNGTGFRDLDDKARMSREALRKTLAIFLNDVISRFGERFLNKEPALDELRLIVEGYEQEGFSGCCGSVDCMNLNWNNCPRELKGQYRNPHNHHKLATVACEALCDHNLYCCHWFVGRCCTNNDLTAMANSALFIDILSGKRTMKLPEGYNPCGIRRQWLLYFLCERIYPRWPIFMGPNSSSTNSKESFMTQRQESVRKDVERLFGCLQGRFKILRREYFEWSDKSLVKIIHVCVILPNMLVKLRLEGELDDEVDDYGRRVSAASIVDEFALDVVVLPYYPTANGPNTKVPFSVEDILSNLLHQGDLATSEQDHYRIFETLTQHLWMLRGESG